jgi:hypothetical protein
MSNPNPNLKIRGAADQIFPVGWIDEQDWASTNDAQKTALMLIKLGYNLSITGC